MPDVATRRPKPGWTLIALGDVVDIINQYWDRDTSVPERLVAGEHIDEGDLRVRRWAMTDDDLIPPTFNRWFQSGDVLLHSRNIKKVAQPDFRGITGEKLFILRSKNESALLQSLVPYLVHSEVFRSYAESRWAGSTNKFLNKTPLQEFEFALPPAQEQARIGKAMEASRSSIEASINLLARLRELRSSLVLAVTGSNESRNSTSIAKTMVRLGDVASVVRGSSPRPAGDKRYFGGDHIPWITVGEITKDDGVFLDSTDTCLTDLGKSLSRVVPEGTVVLSNSGWTLGVPKILRITGCANDGVAAFLDLDPKIDPMFLYFRLFGMTEYLRNVIAAGGDQPNLNIERISQLTIPLCTLTEQRSAVGHVNAVQAEIDKVKSRLTAQKALHDRLATSAFSSTD